MYLHEDDLICQPDKAMQDLNEGKKLLWLEFEIDGKPVLNPRGSPYRFPHQLSAETMKRLHPQGDKIEIVICQKNSKRRTPAKIFDHGR